MGKSANQRAWDEFARLDRASQESIEADVQLTEYQRAAEWDNDVWANKSDVIEPAKVRHVRLFDEIEVGR